MSSDARVAKIETRSEVRARRAAVEPQERTRRRGLLTAQLVELVEQTGARTLTAYASLGSEPDTSEFLAWAREANVRVLLPVALPGHRLAWAWDDGSRVEGLHGISEPGGARLDASEIGDVDLMLVPACAVDERGTRLGWGLGYFDRALGELRGHPPVFAVVDDEDVYSWLPRDPHDVPVTGAVTPTRLLRFNA
ncbi:5-formyltetrahydrofolate cyclo-ligase [Leucobacter sp. USHLN153]|uniref:5-formyltetrahydrofolate cyclo-ligase n=1 Tax=Leucobacter sp. USHLN153 TaxID=3081268 RepID=UPI00301AF1EF